MRAVNGTLPIMAAAHWPTRPDPTRLSRIGSSLKLQLFTTGGRTNICFTKNWSL